MQDPCSWESPFPTPCVPPAPKRCYRTVYLGEQILSAFNAISASA